VWIVPAVAYALVRRRWALAGVTTAVFVVGHRYLPHGKDRELAWTWWQHLGGTTYLVAALAFLVWQAFQSDLRVRRIIQGISVEKSLIGVQ
jgi:alpha-1,2-mannosyltransferase